MKKILMVLMGLEIGGAETHVVGLSLTLKKMGWEVIVASNGGVYEETLREHGIRHFHIPANTRRFRDMAQVYRELQRIITEEKPDVVHAHARIPAFLCGLLQKKMGFPFVTTAHWVFRVNPLLRVLTDWGQQTIAVSQDIREYLIDHYDLPASQIHTTVNGIDTEEFSPTVSGASIREEFRIDENVPVITCVTRLHESRALSAQLLTRIAPELAKEAPGLRILIVGDGERLESLRALGETVNQQLGYPCVTYTGGRTDVPQFIGASDIFVGVSRAALEAMSGGCPTLLCGNEGYGGLAGEENAEDNLSTNYCCRGCTMPDAEKLQKDLTELLHMSRASRQALGMAGRAIVERDFSLMAMARGCQRAYDLALHPRKKVLISGYYGYGNLGDDTILQTICQKYGTDCDLTVLSKHPQQTAKKYGITAIQRFDLWKIHKAMGQMKLLLSGGGSLLQDRTSTRSLLYYLAVIHMALKRNVPVMVYANGIGPIRGEKNRKKTVETLEKVSAITLRDEDSRIELKNMGLRRSDVQVTADPVFAMEPVSRVQAEAVLQMAGIPRDRPLLGISLRAVSHNAAQKLAALLDGVCEDSGCTPVFLCMQTSVDAPAAREVMAQMRTKSFLLPETVSAQEMMGAIGAMKAVISMRLHTLIFAAAAGTPVLGFDYDPKVTSLLRTLKMPALGQVEALDEAAVKAKVLGALSESTQLTDQVKAAAKQLRQRVDENDRMLRQLLDMERPGEPKRRRRVAIFQSDLHVGGIQKSLVNMMSLPMMDDFDVDVYLFDQRVFFDLSEIRPHVHIHYLKPFPYLFRVVPFSLIMRFMPRFHFASEQPYDVAIDFSNYQQDCAFGALTVPARKRVMWIHNDMEIKYREEFKYRILWAFFHSKFHRFTEYTAVSEGIIEPFRKKTGIRNARVTAIPNLINTAEIFEKCKIPIDFTVDPNKVNIASMGHLNHQKGYDIMLDQLQSVCRRRKDLALYIFGDGAEHHALVEQARRNGLEDVVHFMGYQPNPYPYLDRLDAFYLESRYEGQGMVLWEAKALGLPLIFPKRLEKYNMALKGTENIEAALLGLQKTEKKRDDLRAYNEEISRRLRTLIESEP